MILDKQNLFSEDQAITTTAASSNVIDLGADGADVNSPNFKDAEVLVQVTTAFAGGTSIVATLQTDDNAAFSSATSLLATAAIATASLVAGYQFAIGKLPKVGLERYIRINYTVVGTMTAGAVMAGLILDNQTGV